jgi:hypothetical protein
VASLLLDDGLEGAGGWLILTRSGAALISSLASLD